MKSFLGMICARCNIYFRCYKHPSGRYYEGRCPRCARYARAVIDSRSGSKRRFFVYR